MDSAEIVFFFLLEPQVQFNNWILMHVCTHLQYHEPALYLDLGYIRATILLDMVVMNDGWRDG